MRIFVEKLLSWKVFFAFFRALKERRSVQFSLFRDKRKLSNEGEGKIREEIIDKRTSLIGFFD